MPASLSIITEEIKPFDGTNRQEIAAQFAIIQKILDLKIPLINVDLNTPDRKDNNNTLLIKLMMHLIAYGKELQRLETQLELAENDGRQIMNVHSHSDEFDEQIMAITTRQSELSLQIEEMKNLRRKCIEIASNIVYHPEINLNKENNLGATALYYAKQARQLQGDLSALLVSMTDKNAVDKGPQLEDEFASLNINSPRITGKN
jgi:hypothetical protein